MPIFGNKKYGVVGIYEGEGYIPVTITVGGDNDIPIWGDPLTWRSIITGISFAGSSGVDVKHTLRDRIYFYVTTRRAHPVAVSGLAFPGVCGVGGANGPGSVLRYFESYQACSQPRPIRISLDPFTVLRGVMIKFQFSLTDPAFGLGQYAFEFIAPPRSTVPTQINALVGGGFDALAGFGRYEPGDTNNAELNNTDNTNELESDGTNMLELDDIGT